MRDSKVKYLFLLPPLFIVFVTTIAPIAWVLNISAQRWRISRSLTPGPYIGFDNYTKAFADDSFWNAIQVTIGYTVVATVLSILFGLFIAVMLRRTNFRSALVKSVLIFPFAISLTLRGYSFRFMLLENVGVIDNLIDTFIPPLQDIIWLNDPFWALIWLAIPDFWSWGPLCGLMLLGALNNISPEIFEAARVDGASPIRVFWSITLPLLRPMILVVVLLKAIFSIRMFDLVQTMTKGGPGRSTETLNYFIYRIGFNNFDIGYAAALAIIMTAILIIIAYSYSFILMRDE